MKKDIKTDKPEKGQIIVFKAKDGFYPEIGVYQTFDGDKNEIYLPANDDVELLENVEWWSDLPK